MTNKQKPRIRVSKSMLIDAISPIGSVHILATHLEKLLRGYFKSSSYMSYPIVIEEFPGEGISRGQVYKLTISLREVYGFREKTK